MWAQPPKYTDHMWQVAPGDTHGAIIAGGRRGGLYVWHSGYFFFFFFTLVTGASRALSLRLSDTR